MDRRTDMKFPICIIFFHVVQGTHDRLQKLSCSRPQGCGQFFSRNDRNSMADDIQTEDKVNESELVNPYVKGVEPLY